MKFQSATPPQKKTINMLLFGGVRLQGDICRKLLANPSDQLLDDKWLNETDFKSEDFKIQYSSQIRAINS
ncbi:MAG: hypothetical protein KAG53_02905 [Endozoicomonadaceae bacterium]|nr:hypothetical protein [Endozoicomonadaceae bacterium]